MLSALFTDLRVHIGVRSPAAAAGVRAFVLEAGLKLAADVHDADVLVLDDAALHDLDALSDFPGGVVALGGPVWANALSELNLSGWAALPPDAGPAELVAGVLAAAAGLAAVGAAQAERLRPYLNDPDADDPDAEDPDVDEALAATPGDLHLTPREHEVLDLLAAGLSNKRAAKQLGVSEHTVKFHAQAIYSKLGVGSRAAAVTRGVQLGLLSV